MKFLKTIRFDPSDNNVFDLAAMPDEWAIPGGFCFSGAQKTDLKGKAKQAFSNGFLSISSFGFSTFVSVADIVQDDFEAITNILAQRFMSDFGAPNMDAAMKVAQQETSFVVEMCEDAPINTIFAIGRYFDDTGEIREEFRIVQPPSEPVHTKVWEIVD